MHVKLSIYFLCVCACVHTCCHGYCLHPTVTRRAHKCVNGCFDDAAELLRKNQEQKANKSEFCSCQRTNSAPHVVIYADYRAPLKNLRFWSWMIKSISMEGWTCHELEKVGRSVCFRVCVYRCVCDACVGVRRSGHVRGLFMSVLMRAEQWVVLSLLYTVLTFDSTETERCVLTLIRLFDSKPWVVSNQWALHFSHLILCIMWKRSFVWKI